MSQKGSHLKDNRLLGISADDDQANELGIYRDSLSHKNPTVASKSEKAEMTIHADQKTFDA